jgi:hypothetical protein
VVNSPRPRSYGVWDGRNGLLLGLPGSNSVKPIVKLDCSRRDEFGLTVEPGCVLHMHQATITAAAADRTRVWRAAVAVEPGGDLVLDASTFSWFGRLYPFPTHPRIAKGCTYEHGMCALGNGSGFYENCTFRDLDTVFRDGGALEVTAKGCRFEANRQNWALAHTAFGVRAVDCHLEEPQDRTIVCQRWLDPATGQWHYPRFFSQRHVVVAVRDAAGKPVAGARVTLRNEQDDASAVVHGSALTGADGNTPPVDSGAALFLTEYCCRAGADPKQPVATHYTFTLTVTAQGYAPVELKGVDPDQSWQVKEVVLRRLPE